MLEHFLGSRLVRRSADAVLTQYARRRVARLDALDVARTQERTLLKLVKAAADTRFGRDHGFDRVRSVADYRERVPLRDYEAFWQGYWKDVFPRLAGATWHRPVPYHALSSGTTTGTTKYLPITRAMLESNTKAALTTLSLFRHAHPKADLFTGRVFFLGGSTALNEQADGSLAGDLSGIAAREASAFLRPYTFPPLSLGLIGDWEKKVQVLAERSAKLPITVLSGVPAWMLVLFDRLKQVTGKATVRDVWPTLKLVIHGGTSFEPYRRLFEQELGRDVRLLDVYPCSEGYIAAEDPRYDLLRVIPDHGLFFEFVPVEDLGKDRPARHGLAEVETGVQYAVVLTTCAGLWSYVVGDTVRFERRDVPLLRFTGRTKYFLSAFGEHLIAEEVETAVAEAAGATGATLTDFHVGPVFPAEASRPGHHRYFVEFVQPPADAAEFGRCVDAALCRINEDYAAHRSGDLSMLAPEVVPVPAGGFAEWMRSRGKLGGQNKVPRMDNTGQVTGQIADWLRGRG